MITPSEKLYQTAVSFLGKDASPAERADDMVACAESLNQVYKAAFGTEIGGGLSTREMYKVMKNDPRFKKTTVAKRGVIIISPTDYGNGSIPGHCGIFATEDGIFSNTSKDGIWRKNFTIKSWVQRYRGIGELPIMFFEPI